MREIVSRLPGEDIVYLGDTARVPYGIKSRRTIVRFAVENCNYLGRFDPSVIVVACNTASAVAVSTLRETFDIPIFEVIGPGARLAVRATRNRKVGVIATETTIQSEAYQQAIQKLDPTVEVTAAACPLFVPMVEEGREYTDQVVSLVVQQYLERVLSAGVDTLVLGCTHYPLLRRAIEDEVGPAVTVIDSASATADEVAAWLGKTKTCDQVSGGGRHYYYVTDNPMRFHVIGSRFMGYGLRNVTLVSPEASFEPVEV